MTEYIKKYWFLILLAFAASILGLVKLLFPVDQTVPVVVSITPEPGQIIKKPIETIEIQLDKVIPELNDLSLYGVPEIKTEKTQSGTGISFSLLDKLTNNQRSLFELRYKGTTIYSWSYQINIEDTVTAESSGTVTSELGDPDAVQKIAESVLERYPLVKYVPFENDSFSLDYTAPLTLSVRIKSGDKTSVKWQVYEWLKEKGVDPDSHDINWIE